MMSANRVRMRYRVVFEGTYEADPSHYEGISDPKKCAQIDEINASNYRDVMEDWEFLKGPYTVEICPDEQD